MTRHKSKHVVLGPGVQDESSEGGKHDFLAKLVTDWERAAQLPVWRRKTNCTLKILNF